MSNQFFLIVAAGGVGRRMEEAKAKQYLKLENGMSVLDQGLDTLLNIKQIKGCVVAIASKDVEFKHSLFAEDKKLLGTAIGGKERIHSVISALNVLRPFVKKYDWVLVHDAARPCVDAADVIKLIETLEGHDIGGLLATPVVDTLKKAKDRVVESTLDRNQLWQAQTPQMYRFGVLCHALKYVVENNLTATDEASCIEHLGLESILVPASRSNLKITTTNDLALANTYLRTMIKTGLGQDSHAFMDKENKNKKPLILGGVVFKCAQGLKGNSDADVILHSITNAVSSITGVVILGDKADQLCQQGVSDSAEYLKLALKSLAGWRIVHIAIAIECLIPKIAPKMNELKLSVANLVGVSIESIGITATTGEGLTAFGKGEGIQVLSIITVSKKSYNENFA